MLEVSLFACIILPIVAGFAALLVRGELLRKLLLPFSVLIVCIGALLLISKTPFAMGNESAFVRVFSAPILVIDFIILGAIFLIGWQKKHKLVLALAILQFAGMLLLEFFSGPLDTASPRILGDSLSLVMVLVVSLVGGIIAFYSLGYMKAHEEHLHLEISRQPRFFACVLIFLGAMNGLVLSNDLSWLYFFWEVTTLCSYLLISHDETEESSKNALRALWMNSLGGVAFVFGMLMVQNGIGTLAVDRLIAKGASGTIALLPLALLCFAGFTKSAQVPFQSWLCGAMVAPTPVSALLHSSTMVKAGVYLVLRLAPAYAGTALSTFVAIMGAFTFISTAALAAGQSNGKKILAYSTISNLGLIVACAGINTAASISAAMMLIIFHAVSKALLFLCVGAVEQKIGSRNIEDMRSLFGVMPRTALIMALGIFTMMLPPFGMLLSKWMALESSIALSKAMPLVVCMLALGSGLTVLFWGRWAGILLGSAVPKLKIEEEKQDGSIRFALKWLAIAAAVLSLFSPIIYGFLVSPYIGDSGNLSYHVSLSGIISNSRGMFLVYPIFALLGIGFVFAWRMAKKNPSEVQLPYASGIQAELDGKVGFIGPMKDFVENQYGNYYLENIFGEAKLSRPINTIAVVLLTLLIGGVF